MKERIEQILSLADDAGYDCEVYGESARRFQIEVYRGDVESIDRSRDTGIGVRLVRDMRVGYSFSSDLSPHGCAGVFERARENAAASSPLDVDVLAGPPGDGTAEAAGNDLPAKGSMEEKIRGVIEMEQACFDFDSSIMNTEGAGYYEIVAEIMIAGTRGFFRKEKRGLCSCSVSAIAGRNGEVRSGWSYGQALAPAAIDFPSVGAEAARKAVGLLGSAKIPTGRYPVVLSGSAMGDVLGVVEKALSGEMVVKGTTLFAGKLGERIAAEGVTIADDPSMEGGCFNAVFDAEGRITDRNVLVSDGILDGYLHNTYSAGKMDVQGSANAVRESFKSLPVPGPSNFFLVPGSRPAKELLAGLDDGIYVQDIMGIHTADPISGDFSVGIEGYHVRSGRRKNPVTEMTMSGNLEELLLGIRAVGAESIFIGQYGSPDVLIEGLSLSGV